MAFVLRTNILARILRLFRAASINSLLIPINFLGLEPGKSREILLVTTASKVVEIVTISFSEMESFTFPAEHSNIMDLYLGTAHAVGLDLLVSPAAGDSAIMVLAHCKQLKNYEILSHI